MHSLLPAPPLPREQTGTHILGVANDFELFGIEVGKDAKAVRGE